ncbi:WGR domain-containing protein [Kamptonema cortianum]|uniref:WGR domain-containing protein n=1 Tax=Geitlerinema calcuttense NRMC-F 0142 TaxID=2922238 RepID=A0ABT7M050_9CYAN|nr:WGR domain-containing protein [Geitlerinema calcuttense]MDK3160117.1 WGR domain-containing protein [Kamptonema cortianum]MDL5057634.1 WGR domain-containing protein [Geitlerinema calcuttense NRMC-F 0142]
MPSHSIPVDNGQSDLLVTIAHEGCTVTVQENEGRDGRGATVSHQVYEFASETEAQRFYSAKIRTLDPSYAFPTAESVYLEFSDDRAHKFYEVTTVGLTVTIRYGRMGAAGQTSSNTYDTVQQARAAAQQKINEKLKKGYARSQPSKPSREAIPYWLPEDFRVYINERGIVGNHAGGMREVEGRILPTVNQYRGVDGGYVAFYSRDPTKAVYSVGGGIYVVGQIRLKGRYKGRIFHPEGYENQDISAAQEFKELCFKTFGVQGWAGGDTGGWFGR